MRTLEGGNTSKFTQVKRHLHLSSTETQYYIDTSINPFPISITY